jgi:hypothetical protein
VEVRISKLKALVKKARRLAEQTDSLYTELDILHAKALEREQRGEEYAAKKAAKKATNTGGEA